MERQIKHRILGILVMIGLVIILLPLFQNGKEVLSKAILVKAPPFPDQALPITPAVVQTASVTPSITPTIASAASLSPVPASQPVVDQDQKKQATVSYKIIEGEKAMSLLKHTTTHQHTHAKKSVVMTKQNTKKTVSPAKVLLPVTASLDDDGLIKLKSAVWVIQIGSFKNKANALKTVNQLRSNGYRAFIQQFSNAFGEHTSVFVGPANNSAAARTLADRLKNEMHIQGIVISYKPLTL